MKAVITLTGPTLTLFVLYFAFSVELDDNEKMSVWMIRKYIFLISLNNVKKKLLLFFIFVTINDQHKQKQICTQKDM